ncbi:MAG: ClpXP protease specificity-enhancing factor [Snodgrassella sp.]|jgi:stringent starvation protein B|uniref:ClpXP protease specificity-enhancing factor n=1 Tax=Snodgrassella alvi TaxID=1196083 RepID=A0A2N9XK17_9NEIS|nr:MULTISPECIES: ClpXP protease specificity-enhancing factor [Snodgrassella]MCO6508724.1 ClpXP protease specificity-enhancing factor [Snodgrassella sp.]MCO6515927.1 ClpXP protease specificity-enhancing factor [Snodgrassella sp.]MCO6526392.1 ClpXP protease specificity-enhancing factor [Snodgrassella sp.]PIT11242.1 ClpXP protease specificity-enhancing factor [Snodgrassella communis]PIT20640.1 ClpXP protease specificity-enhancing factor [Snodgrassella communis]
MSKLSTKPYILRALYEWALDSGYTPHIVAWVNDKTCVPRQYVRDNEIVLNIGAVAAHNLNIDNEWVSFAARFNGVSHDIWIPVGHVISLFARETGEGMGFEVEPFTGDDDVPATEDGEAAEAETAAEPKPAADSVQSGAKKGLKIIK